MPPRKRAAPRVSKAKSTCKMGCCALSDDDRARIKGTLDDYYPGKWAEQIDYGPACRCGLKTNPMTVGFGVDDGRCERHGPSVSDG